MSSASADVYRRFADLEARGVSDVFFEWASSIADDPVVLERIESLPRPKRQPNLVFAGARLRGAPVGPYGPFRAWLLDHWDEVSRVIHTRATQTNEAARCAVLLPVLSRLEGPLALIEAGASAGLCLYPDRYSYRYDADGERIDLDPPTGPGTVELPCTIDMASAPARLPNVVWRAGVDLNPLDVSEPDDLAWLTALVWPEHHDRRARLAAAASVVASDPPLILRGDLVTEIEDLINRAPSGLRVVVFHSAVLVYLDPEERRQFIGLMQSRDDVTWISNEGAAVLPEISSQVTVPIGGRTILSVDGRAVALVGPHGQSYAAL